MTKEREGKMNGKTTVFAAMAFAAAGLTLFGGGHERKKFVALGWDVMWATPQQLLERADEFQSTGVSGIVPTLFGELPDGTRISPRRLMHEPAWTEEAFAKDAPVWKELLAKPCFSESFAAPLRMPTNRVAWADDAWWARVAGNMRVFGRVAKDFGFRGIEIDHEDYPNARPMVRRDDDPPFAELAKLVRRRGREMFRPFFEEFPDAVLFGCRFFTVDPDFWNYYYGHPDPLARAEAWGDLWPAFLNGLLDAMPRTAILVEGDESGYRYESSRKEFHEAYARLNQRLLPLIEPKNRIKYRALSRVAFPVYLDMYSAHDEKSRYYRGPVGGSRAIHCERNLSEAFDASDSYCWVYGERAAWVHWPKHPDPRATLGGSTWDELLPGLYSVLRAKSDPDGFAKARFAGLTADERAANILKGVVESAARPYTQNGFHVMSSLPRPFVGWQAKENPGTFGIVTKAGEPPALCAEGVGRGGIMFSDTTLKEGDYVLISLEMKGRSTGVYSRVLREGIGQDLMYPTVTFASSEGMFADWHRVHAILRIPDDAQGLMVSADMKLRPGERLLLRGFHCAPIIRIK